MTARGFRTIYSIRYRNIRVDWMLVVPLTGAVALAVLPVLAAKIPPLLDYPAHLARVGVLLDLERGGARFGRVYALDSFLLPNVALDLIALALAHGVTVETAGRIFVGSMQLLTVAGCVALGRAATGRVGIGPFVACIYLCNGVLAYGFVNYMFGLALLLFACASWIALDDRGLAARSAAGAGFALLLFFAHLVALGLFGVFVAAFEWHSVLSGGGVRRALAAGTPFVAPAGLLAASPTGSRVVEAVTYDWTFKLAAVPANFVAGSAAADLSASVLVLVGGLILAGGRAVRLPRLMWPPLAAMAVAFVVLPAKLFSANGVDARLPIAIWLVGAASLDFRLDRRATCVVAAAIGLVLWWRALAVAEVWGAYDRVYDQLRAELRHVPDGGTLFSIRAMPEQWTPPLNHADALAALDGAVFVPTMFATRGQQPIVARGVYAAEFDLMALDPLEALTPGARETAVASIRRAAAGDRASTYILVLTESPGTMVAPGGTEKVADGPRSVLVRVVE